MKKTRTAFIVALLAIAINSYAVTVKTPANLNVYFPEYSRIDLVCDQMPKAAQKDVEFCCEAAFTGELLEEFKHSNVADNHICNGVMKKDMGFCQMLIIKDGSSIEIKRERS